MSRRQCLFVTSEKSKREHVFKQTVKRLRKFYKSEFQIDINPKCISRWNDVLAGKPNTTWFLTDFLQYDIYAEYCDNKEAETIINSYIDKPSAETARAFLTYLQIPIPLETLVRKVETGKAQKVFHDIQCVEEIKCRGGGRKVQVTPQLLEAFVSTDTIHDYISYGEKQTVINWLWKQQTIFEHKFNTGTLYNENVCKAWMKKANADSNRVSFISRQNGKFSSSEDVQLLERFKCWASQTELTMIIDGLIGNTDFHTFIQTACVLMLFENGTKLLNASVAPELHLCGRVESNLKKITFMQGYFYDVDGNYTNMSHLQPWVDYMKKFTTRKGKILVIDTITMPGTTTSHMPSKYYMRTYMDAHNTIHLPSGMQTTVQTEPWYSSNEFPIHLPYGKGELCEAIERVLGKQQPLTITEEQQLRDAMELNFFRDAYMCDIALQGGCVLFTRDRLAFMLHTLMAMENSLPPNGMFMNIQEIESSRKVTFGFAR